MARLRTISDEEILCKARGLFIEHGHTLATGVIADELGVSQATLFKRFGSKDELLLAALAPPEEQPIFTDIAAGPQSDNLLGELETLIAKVIALVHGLLPSLLVLKAAGFVPEKLFDRYETPPPMRMRAALVAWFTKARDEHDADIPDPARAAVVVHGAVLAELFMNVIYEEGDAEPNVKKAAKSIAKLLWRGIAPKQ